MHVLVVCDDSYEEEEEEEEEQEEGGDDDLDCLAPTPKRCKLAKEKALEASLHSGLYPTFEGIEGPFQDIPPNDNNALEYLQFLWPASLCKLIAVKTNRYVNQRGVANWQQTDSSEVWKFLGIVVLMGTHRLPHIRDYWSRDPFLGVQYEPQRPLFS